MNEATLNAANPQAKFLSDLAPELVSEICSNLPLRDFYRFQSCSKAYHDSELYSGSLYEGLTDEFVFLLDEKLDSKRRIIETGKADEILANIVKKGFKVEFNLLQCLPMSCYQ